MPIVLDGSQGITTPTYGGADTSEYLVPVTQFKNRIINGAMVISQRGTSFAGVANTDPFTLDRWEASQNASTATYSVSQSSVVPNGNFTNSALLTVTSAVSPSGTQYAFFQTKIEGYNMADLGWGTANAQAVTISFWARSSVTGTYSFHLINANTTLSYIATFTISVANTWQFVTLTIPGPTTGTWNTTNGVGIYAGIDLGMGSSRQTTANTWSSGASFFCGTSSNVQWIANSGATFYITGVQLEVGSTATSFDYRPYTTELQLCQRYYWRNQPLTNNYTSFTSGVMYGASEYFGYVAFPVSMRSTPSFGVSSVSDFQLITTFGSTLTAFTLEGASPISARLSAIPSSSRTAGHGAYIQANNTASAWIAFSAEL